MRRMCTPPPPACLAAESTREYVRPLEKNIKMCVKKKPNMHYCAIHVYFQMERTLFCTVHVYFQMERTLFCSAFRLSILQQLSLSTACQVLYRPISAQPSPSLFLPGRFFSAISWKASESLRTIIFESGNTTYRVR